MTIFFLKKILRLSFVTPVFMGLFIACRAHASTIEPFDTIAAPVITVHEKLPHDISFCIADLKYNYPTIKICEFGQATRSKFKGYEQLFGEGKIWSLFWHYLAHLNLASIFVEDKYNTRNKQWQQEMALTEFMRYGGHVTTPSIFFHHVFGSIKNTRKRINSPQSNIIIYPHFSPTIGKCFLLQKNNLSCFLDFATEPYVNNKYATHKIMCECSLHHYRPTCFLSSKYYTHTLAAKIQSTMPAEKYVIKPLNAAKGLGVIIINHTELDRTLKKLFAKKSAVQPKDPLFSYWKKDRNTLFLVEEYVASKAITIDNLTYDPTMRIIFALRHQNGRIFVDFCDGYWKLPIKALNENGTLTEKHKSNINPHRSCSAKIDPDDFNYVKSILRPILANAYLTMLRHTAKKLT